MDIDPLRIFGLLEPGDLAASETAPELGRGREASIPSAGLLDGRYRIRKVLGTGGFGAVLQAHDESLNRDVALKLLRRTSVEARARFRREAEATASVRHPNVLAVFAVGETEDHPYIVYELIEDAQDLAEAFTSVEREDRLDLFEQALAGVAAAHARGVVHRDLKPENVLVKPSGHVQVADFGMARVEESDLTQSGALLGTPFYMAPEQITGLPVSPATDVWSLGLLLYEALYGRPWTSDNVESLPELTGRILGCEFERPAGAPAAIERLLFDRVLVQEADRRLPDAGAFLESLREARQNPSQGGPRLLGAALAIVSVFALAVGALQWAPQPKPDTASAPLPGLPAEQPLDERSAQTARALDALVRQEDLSAVLELLRSVAATRDEPLGSPEEARLARLGVEEAIRLLGGDPEDAAVLLEALAETGVRLEDPRPGSEFLSAAFIMLQTELEEGLYWRFVLASARLDFPFHYEHIRPRERGLRRDTRPWSNGDRDPWKRYLNLRVAAASVESTATRQSVEVLAEFLQGRGASLLGPRQFADAAAKVAPQLKGPAAEALLDEAVRRDPTNALVQDARARIAHAAGQPELAILHASKAVELLQNRTAERFASRTYTSLLLNQLVLLGEADRRAEARRVYTRLLKVGPYDGNYAVRLFPWLTEEEENDERR